MEIEYYYKNKKFKDEGVQIRVTTDSGVVKAVCMREAVVPKRVHKSIISALYGD